MDGGIKGGMIKRRNDGGIKGGMIWRIFSFESWISLNLQVEQLNKLQSNVPFLNAYA